MKDLTRIMKKYAEYYNTHHIFAEYIDGKVRLYLEFKGGERIYVN